MQIFCVWNRLRFFFKWSNYKMANHIYLNCIVNKNEKWVKTLYLHKHTQNTYRENNNCNNKISSGKKCIDAAVIRHCTQDQQNCNREQIKWNKNLTFLSEYQQSIWIIFYYKDDTNLLSVENS